MSSLVTQVKPGQQATSQSCSTVQCMSLLCLLSACSHSAPILTTLLGDLFAPVVLRLAVRDGAAGPKHRGGGGRPVVAALPSAALIILTAVLDANSSDNLFTILGLLLLLDKADYR